jgi:hypothetical protein
MITAVPQWTEADKPFLFNEKKRFIGFCCFSEVIL